MTSFSSIYLEKLDNDLDIDLGHDGSSGGDEVPANFGGDFYVSMMMDNQGYSAWRYLEFLKILEILDNS